MSSSGEGQAPTGTGGRAKNALELVLTIFDVSRQLNKVMPSDIILSPGRAPQVKLSGKLQAVEMPAFTPDDTARIVDDLLAKNEPALNRLRQEGSCEISVSLPKLARLRVHIFRQRGTYAVAIRVARTVIPDLASLGLPAGLANIATLEHGLVLVAGGPGSGKSHTLAAILNEINRTIASHVITLENPIEFLHPHNKSVVHQRELHSDIPSYELGIQAALKQGANVILVSELSDQQTIELAMTAADGGRLVLSTIDTANVVRTLERIVGIFPSDEQKKIRGRLSRSFRYLIAQQLLPRIDQKGRVAIFEILRANPRSASVIERGEDWDSLMQAMSQGKAEGMQSFDDEIEKLARARIISVEVALRHSSRPELLRMELADLEG